MAKVKFSIITPTYNRVKSGYLKLCIESIQMQKRGDYEYEHLIIDDGSTDSTKEFVQGMADNDNRIKYHHKQNGGPAKTIQAGLKLATNEYVIILDDDDLLPIDSLKLRAEYINNHTGVDWFYGLSDWIDEYGLPMAVGYQSKYYEYFLYERLLITNFVHGGTPTIKRVALNKIKWPEWLERSQDYFMWLELMRPENKLVTGFLDEFIYTYRIHSQNYTTGIDSNVTKKLEKEQLNFRIKSLHPEPLAFLAKEAYTWLEEAHKTNNYWKQQNKVLTNELTPLVRLVETYKTSRIIGKIIRLGNLKRRINKRLDLYEVKIHKKITNLLTPPYFKLTPQQTEVIEKPVWDDTNPLVSVITPFYNRSDTMPETIRSILGQTFQNFEYIIVDDGSNTDEAIDYLEKIIHPKIRIIRQDNQGVAKARNRGIEEASGKYVLCLDSDDILETTFIEKAVVILEADPEAYVVSFDTKMFGEIEDLYIYRDFDPLSIDRENMIQTAAVFRREAWAAVGGYKDDIGYEDWEFWVNLTKHGYFAKHVSEVLFRYRTAEQSRYVDDLENHIEHTRHIEKLHPDFKQKTKDAIAKKALKKRKYDTESVFRDISGNKVYRLPDNNKPNVLIAVPWMTFGGAETLINNFCREIKNEFNLSFMTGLKAQHEWEYKFKEITPNIYHLANLFENEQYYLEFISNYITTRKIDLLHIIHTSYVFKMLPELKRRHPSLKVIVTVFNDRAHFDESLDASSFVDIYSTDNSLVAEKYSELLNKKSVENKVSVIPNGIDIDNIYNPSLFDRSDEREKLGIKENEISVFFIGRLSEEKNPDVFLEAANLVTKKEKAIKFFIVGGGNMRREITHKLKEIKNNNIKYLGYQSQVANLLSAADIFVLPSSIEGFPLSILEAMAMKVAVVSSDVGAVRDILNNRVDGIIVNPGSKHEIANAVVELAQDKDLLQSFKNKSRKKVESSYSSKMLGDNYSKLYRGVLE